MKLQYVKADPTGNITILITTPVPRADQPKIAAQLLACEELDAEQVGFLEAPTLPGARMRLQMEGGEFCGNATMSLAALLAREDNLPEGEEAIYALEVSGAESLVPCRITRTGDAAFTGTVSMPLPERFDLAEVAGYTFPLVRFPGIAHMLVPRSAMTPAEAEIHIARLCAELDVDALGILLAANDASSMLPLVYVRETDTAVWEHGCGSGSAALAAGVADASKRDTTLEISQPGGTITASAAYADGSIQKIEIRGDVWLVEDGEAEVV